MSNLIRLGDVEFMPPCDHQHHFPPSKEMMEPGQYSYNCPGCGYNHTFSVRHRKINALIVESPVRQRAIDGHIEDTNDGQPYTREQLMTGPGDPT